MNKTIWLFVTFLFLCENNITGNNNQEEIKGNIMINIGIDDKIRKSHAEQLNILLADEYVLYTKTLKFHWNVKGKWFGPLHKLFNDQYEQLLEIADLVAERIRMLGFDAAGSLKEFSDLATLSEEPMAVKTDAEMIKLLLQGHEHVIREIRDFIEKIRETNDSGLENVLQDIMSKHEKNAWMLRSHLE
jgi:starvation-inducible DNA-binding protein